MTKKPSEPRSKASTEEETPAQTIALPFFPFIKTADDHRLGELPLHVSERVDSAEVYELPSDISEIESLLHVYIADLDYLIYPGCHQSSSSGRFFTNVSYYTDLEEAEAYSSHEAGVSRTVVSIGLVRHLAALASEIYRLVCPIVFQSPAPPRRLRELNLRELILFEDTANHAEFLALMKDYPRLFGIGSDESEFILFADMLRFVWCHEWAHGLAGHSQFVKEELGLLTISETGTVESSKSAVMQALEFEADSMALKFMLSQILKGLDMPGRVVTFRGELWHRILWLLLAVSMVIAQWGELDRGGPAEHKLHPAPEFRYLNVWDIIRTNLMLIGDHEAMLSLNAFAYQIIHEISKELPLAGDLLAVTPFVHETPSVKESRNAVDRYVAILEALELRRFRHEIDSSICEQIATIRK